MEPTEAEMSPQSLFSGSSGLRLRALQLAIGVGAVALGAASLMAFGPWRAQAQEGLLWLSAAIGFMMASVCIALTGGRDKNESNAPKPFDPSRFVTDSSEAAFLVGVDGRIHGANAHFAALAAIDPDRVDGAPVTEALPGPIVEAITVALEHGLDVTGSIECENQIGEWLIVDMALRPCEIDGGRGFAITMRDLTEARRREIELATLAFQDPLTHLANRAAVQRRLLRVKDDLAEGPEASFAIMALDLDRFKIINDQLGHAAGDQLLVEIAARIVAALPRNAFVGRYGGDEFVIVVGPRVGRATARQFALRVIESTCRPVPLASGLVDVGLSIGIALAPADGDDAMKLLEDADSAMYRAKRARAGVAFADEIEVAPDLKSVA